MELPTHLAIANFVRESNRIEGIPTVKTSEVTATACFLGTNNPSVGDIQELLRILQPDAVLRCEVGLDVRVANHLPIPGGPDVTRQLVELIDRAKAGDDPFDVHVEYERLHPFTDGNGRSGRALWAWQNCRHHGPRYGLALGFLHEFYYQTLARNDRLAMRAAVLEHQIETLRAEVGDET